MAASDVAFSPSVKEIQTRKGSRRMFARADDGESWPTTIDEALAGYLGQMFSVFLATASAEGQPYVQHRGGPPGFLRVLGPTRLGLADYAGNRQYITLGNLAENPRALIFAMDWQNRRRVKIWGRAHVVEDDPDLIAAVTVEGARGRVERAIVFEVETWNVNCPQHIPQLVPAAPVSRLIDAQDQRIVALEQEVERLKAALAAAGLPIPDVENPSGA